jgi:hypothetical protein
METKTVVMKQANIDRLIGIYKESRSALISKIRQEANLLSIGQAMNSMLDEVKDDLSLMDKLMAEKGRNMIKEAEEKHARNRIKMIETLDQIDSVLEDLGVPIPEPSKQSIIEMTEVVIK